MTIRKQKKTGRTVSVDFSADQFERVAANFGLFSPEFLRSIESAERDIRAGKIREVGSLRDLRK